ncbi:MAG: sulfide/dihydroorotate dehydrogenase-like FAD/NAD-binding protein [Lachnospiraceae bacterium]|nr:sulfide/dihydroorotate dehydrogenase-like FAD/NAD-binding protein [Lachnospiraceae bacterium]
MYKIVRAEALNANVYLWEVEAPRIAKHCMPGQFVIVRKDADSERIPLTICDYDREKGTITIVVQTIGAGTKDMTSLKTGDYFHDFVGPLGNPSEFCNMSPEELKKERVVFIAGGLGTAPVYCQVKWMHEQGVDVDVIIGARTKDILIYEEEMKAVAGNLYITTDDGSYGRTGNVTVCLNDIIKEENKQYTKCVAIGPMIMMKFAALATKELGIPTIVSMNTIMVDGTGMCGACRLTVGGEVKFACVDGPEFDGHLVDFDQAMKRQALYKTEEGKALLALEKEKDHHECSCHAGGAK